MYLLHPKTAALTALIALLGQVSAAVPDIGKPNPPKPSLPGPNPPKPNPQNPHLPGPNPPKPDAPKPVGLKDIKHAVLFMQENRAFDNYYGTMQGVRGFNDANVQMNGGVPVWDQLTDPKKTNTPILRPWYLNYLGGNYTNATQCMTAGSNNWQANHIAYNGGLMDHWVLNNTAYSIGFFEQQDIPVQWAIADWWTLADMYQEGAIAPTNPNRVMWLTGSINVPGGHQTPDQGGNPYIDNNESPGCDQGNFNCYPLNWTTAAELYQGAGVEWQVFQDADNFDDNALVHFVNFKNAKEGDELFKRGVLGQTLDDFYARAANGTLPAVSYIVAPTELSEHPPYSPRDGGWIQWQVVNAVTTSPKYNETVLMLSYDESGGWFDHVTPYTSPEGTPGEWLEDPYKEVGMTPSGPGIRLPFTIVSCYTKGSYVYTSHADHNSQILFVEEWLASKGINVTTNEMSDWRREHMSNLVDAFDFDNPDCSVPNIPEPPEPHKDAHGKYNGAEVCEATYSNRQPPIPYTGPGATKDMASLVEEGFKQIRGTLTEGRFLTFEISGWALTQVLGALTLPTPATPKHDNIDQRWRVEVKDIGGTDFYISTADGKKWMSLGGVLVPNKAQAMLVSIQFHAGKGYTMSPTETGLFLNADSKGFSEQATLPIYFDIYSVSYH